MLKRIPRVNCLAVVPRNPSHYAIVSVIWKQKRALNWPVTGNLIARLESPLWAAIDGTWNERYKIKSSAPICERRIFDITVDVDNLRNAS